MNMLKVIEQVIPSQPVAETINGISPLVKVKPAREVFRAELGSFASNYKRFAIE